MKKSRQGAVLKNNRNKFFNEKIKPEPGNLISSKKRWEVNFKMKVMEKIGAIPEPQWILDRTGSGPLYWRRESAENNSRVKFRYDVDIKEFQRGAHELEEAEWSKCLEETTTFTMGLTCILCVAVTMVLPWYIMIGPN